MQLGRDPRQMTTHRVEFRIFYPSMSPVTISADDRIMFRQSRYVHCGRDVVGLFSNDMRVRDVQRYTIIWPTGTNVPCLQVNSEKSFEFRESAYW